jgi:zinc protease
MKDIKGITVEQIEDYYRQFYAPNNAVLVVFGDADPKAVKELAEQYFGNYQAQSIDRIQPIEPSQDEERALTIEKMIKIPYIIMVYKLPAGNHPDLTSIEILLEILINKPTSRINTELKQNQEVILGAGSWVSRLPIPGYAQVILIPSSVQKIETVTKGFDLELSRLIENGITDEELQVIKKKVLKELVFAQKDLKSFKDIIIEGRLNYNDPDFYQKEIKAINALTKEDLIKAAKKYFDKQNRTVGYIVPQNN